VFRGNYKRIAVGQDKPSHQQWLQDIHADCIPIEGREDLMVILVSREGTVLHTAVVPTFEDTDPIGPESPELRPMPYGRYRTSAKESARIEEAVIVASKDTQESSLQQQPNQLSKALQVTAPTK